MSTRSLVILCLLASLGATACANRGWKQATSEDSPAAYYRFMRDNPGSDHVPEARERLEFHQLRANPSLAGFQHFVDRYPQSELIAELSPMIEQQAFSQARLAGTPAAYEAFASEFAGSPLADRARGNAAYLAAAASWSGSREALQRFAAQYPESDFAAEARRSAEVLAARATGSIRTVSLVIAIEEGTPERDRIEGAFRERAREAFERAGLEQAAPADGAGGLQAGVAEVRIDHREETVQTALAGDELLRPGGLATTRVSFRAALDAARISDRKFTLRIEPRDHSADRSVLFSAMSEPYWREFFVPVTSWDASRVLRRPFALPEPAVAVAAGAGRALALAPGGGVRLFDLSDPESPVELAEYVRPSDHKTFDHLRVLGRGRVVVYGADGIEIVSFTPEGPRATARFERGSVGSVSALHADGDQLLIGSSQGLLLLDLSRPDAEPVSLMRGPVRGVAVVGEQVVFTDGDSVYFSTLEQLRENGGAARMRLGREFAPSSLHPVGEALLVRGASDSILLDLRDPAKPRLDMRLAEKDVGRIHDVVVDGNSVYLLGDHGLQLLDPATRRTRVLADAVARSRLALMERHLVAIDGETLQVIDTTGFRGGAAPAAN